MVTLEVGEVGRQAAEPVLVRRSARRCEGDDEGVVRRQRHRALGRAECHRCLLCRQRLRECGTQSGRPRRARDDSRRQGVRAHGALHGVVVDVGIESGQIGPVTESSLYNAGSVKAPSRSTMTWVPA